MTLSQRVDTLHRVVLGTRAHVCAERALLVTRFHRSHALAHVLERRQAIIYPEELLVGCFTRHRVGGGLFPEPHGVAMLEDLTRFEKRSLNPLQIAPTDRRRLALEVVPYWATRFLAMRIRPLRTALRFVKEQLRPTWYLVNETGGISHFVPDYEQLLQIGTAGFRSRIAARLESAPPGSEAAHALEAMRVALRGLEAMAANFATEADAAAQRSSSKPGTIPAASRGCSFGCLDTPRTSMISASR